MLDGVYIIFWMCFCCEIYCKGKVMFGKVFDVLNEIVVDWGFNLYFFKIECYEYDCFIIKVCIYLVFFFYCIYKIG